MGGLDLRTVAVVISIHALREEGDVPPRSFHRFRCHFYPRPPRGGRPSDIAGLRSDLTISIHALREEGDAPRRRLVCWARYFYPRPPRGGRLQLLQRIRNIHTISIHALREEGDLQETSGDLTASIFLSTPSARRATAPGAR